MAYPAPPQATAHLRSPRGPLRFPSAALILRPAAVATTVNHLPDRFIPARASHPNPRTRNCGT